MKKLLAAIILGSGFAAAQAQTVVIDSFHEHNSYSLPTDPNYGANWVGIHNSTIFGYQGLGAADFEAPRRRHRDENFDERSGHGELKVEGEGDTAGQLDLTYANANYGPADVSGYGSVILDVLKVTKPVNVGWGFYSGGFVSGNQSFGSMTISSAGIYTLNFSSLTGALDTTDVQSLWFEMDVCHGGELKLGSVSLGQPVATPEPAPFVGMGLGVGLLALRRRKRA